VYLTISLSQVFASNLAVDPFLLASCVLIEAARTDLIWQDLADSVTRATLEISQVHDVDHHILALLSPIPYPISIYQFAMSAAVVRPRRQSFSTHNAPKTAILAARRDTLEPPPRPKSTPVEERPRQRRRQNPEPSSDEDEGDDDAPDGAESLTSMEAEPAGPTAVSVVDRPTRPLPRKTVSASSHSVDTTTTTAMSVQSPLPRIANPAMLPVQAHVPRGGPASTQRRLFVVLEQACLESYRVTSGGKSKNGRGEEGVKYALLNCDDHQGILAKMNRDIADARPDITHQVRLRILTSHVLHALTNCSLL
jgi:rRNA small subunit pseudouridine methyltransferase Nep1